MKKISSSVDEKAKSATLLNDSGVRRKTPPSYLERLRFTHVLPGSSSFTDEQLDKLISMPPDEQKWRNAFFDFLIHENLLEELQKLPTEELRQFVFMEKDEQGKWKQKLADQKAQREQQPPLARTYKPGKDKIISMEVRMLPPLREYVDHLAAHNGMHAQEFVEHLIVEAINKNPHDVKHGEQLLKEFGGSLSRVKRHVHEEEIARLRQMVSTGSSPRR